jgi:death on curing protein
VTEWIWLAQPVVLAVHDEQIAQHGGASGLRDLGLLQSALARPQHLAGYEGDVDVARLATAYAFGIARNHPFVDGNERTALVTLELFLELNGFRLVAGDADTVTTILALAAGVPSEPDLADWVRRHCTAA